MTVYCHSNTVFTTQEVLDILHHPDRTRVITEPPIKPAAGTAYLYHYEDESKKDDWKCDQYYFHNDGIRKQPRSDPKFNKNYFVIRTLNGGKDGRFKKISFRLLLNHGNLVLFQYVGDHNIAVDLPHGNSNDRSSVYRRVCPSSINRIKEMSTSSDPSEVLETMETTAKDKQVPDIHAPRSLLHVQNTINRTKRKRGNVGKKRRKRKKRKLNNGGASESDSEQRQEPLHQHPEGNNSKTDSTPNDEHHETGLPLGVTRDLTVDIRQNARLQVKECRMETDVEILELVKSQNDATCDYNGRYAHLEIASLVQGQSEDAHHVTEMLSQSHQDVTHDSTADILQKARLKVEECRMETDGKAIEPLPPQATGDVRCSDAMADNLKPVHNRAHVREAVSVGSDTSGLNEAEKSDTCIVLTRHLADFECSIQEMLTSDVINIILEATRRNGDITELDISLPLEIDSLVSQTFSLWPTQCEDVRHLISKHEVSKKIYHMRPSQIKTLASFVVAAVMTNTKLRPFLETLNPCPAQIEGRFISDTSLNAPTNIRVGSYNLSKEDARRLEANTWLDDSVIHAYLHILQEDFAVRTQKKAFILECFNYIKWESSAYDQWMFEGIKVLDYEWLLLPICVNHHWVMLAANIPERTVRVINSKPSPELHTTIIGHWSSFMDKRSSETSEDLGEWKVINCDIFPQTDGNSCGVRILMAAESLLKDCPLSIMRDCHVRVYRQYIRERLFKAAENTYPKTRSAVAENGTEVRDIVRDTADLESVFENSANKEIEAYKEVMDLSVQDSVVSRKLQDLLTASSSKEDTSTGKEYYGPLCLDMYSNNKKEFALLVLLCLESETEAFSSPTSTCSPEQHLRWACLLSGLSQAEGPCINEMLSNLKCEDPDYYQKFRHQDIIETINSLLTQKSESFLSEIDIQFIYKFVRIDVDMAREKTLVIVLDSRNQNYFVSRMAMEIQKGHFAHTVTHSAFSVPSFCVQLIKEIRKNKDVNLEKLIHMTDIDFGGTFSHWLCFNSNAELYKMLFVLCDQDLTDMFTACIISGNLDILQMMLQDTDCTLFRVPSLEIPGIQENGEVVTLNTLNLPLLHLASYHGNDHSISILLERGHDVNSQLQGYNPASKYIPVGSTPLSLAAMRGHLSTVQCLIQKGADAKHVDNNYNSSLHLACSEGHVDIVRHLVKMCQTSQPNVHGNTPLHLACNKQDDEIIKLLLHHRADVMSVNFEDNSPLDIACLNGDLDIVKLLYTSCPIYLPVDGANTALHKASRSGRGEIVEYLLDKQANQSVNNDDNNPLVLALKKGHLDLAVVLVKRAPRFTRVKVFFDLLENIVNTKKLYSDKKVYDLFRGIFVSRHSLVKRSMATLYCASCKMGHLEIVKLLIENGVDVSVSDDHGDKPLTAACMNGHFEIVKLLIEKGADVSAGDDYGNTPLTAACMNGHFEIVKLLIEKGADVSAGDDYGNTPLTAACMNGHFEIVKLLVENGVDVSAAGGYGDTPLTAACVNGHIEIVKLLIEKGADVSAGAFDGHTPLSAACENGHIEIVKLLIEKGADVSAADRYRHTPLTAACGNGHIEIVKLLIEKGADVSAADRYRHTPLTAACMNGHFEIVKLLVENGVDVSAAGGYGDTPLTAACVNGHIEIVKLLIEKGADVSAGAFDGHTPLSAACENGHIEIVKLLIEKGADVSAADRYRHTPLTAACGNGHIEIVKLLIEKGADVSAADRYRHTPLTAACGNGHIEIVQLLVEKGADVSAARGYGHTPLSAACVNGDIEIVKLLIEKGADVSAAAIYCKKVMIVACENGHIEIVKLLIEKGADVSGAARYVDKLMIWACGNGHIDIVKLLVEKGADVSAGARNGHTPLSAACVNGHIEIVKLLILKGADVSAAAIYGDKVMIWACGNGHIDIVKLLVEKGADVSAGARNGHTPLTAACVKGNFEIVKLLIEKGADVSAAAGEYGHTPLTAACVNGHIEIVQLLIEKGADVSAAVGYGDTPLTVACKIGHIEIVQLLIEKGADVSAADEGGDRPLTVACENGHIEIIQLLIEKGADVSAADEGGHTPLSAACVNGHIEIVKLLILKGADVSAAAIYGDTVMIWACENGHIEIAKLLIEKGADVPAANVYGNTPLTAACENGHTEIVKVLIEKGAYLSTVGEDGHTPLFLARENGHIEIVKLLIEKGANVSATCDDGSTALTLAQGNIGIMKLSFGNKKYHTEITNSPQKGKLIEENLTEDKANLTRMFYDELFNLNINICFTFLLNHCSSSIREKTLKIVEKVNSHSSEICFVEVYHLALESRCLFVLQILMNDISSIDVENTLVRMSELGHLSLCRTLLERVQSADGKCLMAALKLQNINLASMLIDKTQDLTFKDNECNTVLHMACTLGDSDIVRGIIVKGVKLDEINKRLQTPLHVACEHGYVDVVQQLLSVNIDVNISQRDDRGNTVFHIVCANRDLKTLILLVQFCLSSIDNQPQGR